MSRSVRRGRTGIALIALTAAVASQVGMGTAQAAPTASRADALVDTDLSQSQLDALRQAVQQSRTLSTLPSSGPYSFFLELDATSSGQVFAANRQRGTAAARGAAVAAKARIVALQRELEGRLESAAPGTRVLYRTSTVSAGVAVTTDVTNYRALTGLPGVRAVRGIAPKVPDNAGTTDLTRAAEVWEALGNTGQGIDVGIIDTGIDYTHTDFGGSGSEEQYLELAAAETEPAPAGVFPSAKVVGGYDFVGFTYNADPADPGYQPIPLPDPNPLDCNGHGTHVAGTAAGYGVNPDGSTFTGSYDTDLDLKSLRIGPGMAPEANLWALQVFGCEGSTDVTGAALEFSGDPNGDGSPDDALDVVNLSLGSAFAPQDDADGVLAGELMDIGVMMVLSAGNSGDTYDANGAPGNNPDVLSVAATDDGFAVFDGWEIISDPELFDPDVRPGLRSVLFEGEGDFEGDLTLPVPGDDPAACSPLSGDYSGQFLVILADGFACGSITKSSNAKAAGADGFVIVADDDALETGINGDPDIPGILVGNADGNVLIDELESGNELTIAFGDSYANAASIDNPDLIDTIASFTSRGSRGSAKPDVAAPGVNTVSAGVSTGSAPLTLSGTSMASPATAGLAALVRAQHPEWTTAQVKADIMNTAVHDLYTEPGQTGLIYGPNRVGSGRIDAPAAVNNEVLAYVQGDPGTSVVSASFGVVEVADPVATLARTIVVDNTSDRQRTYDLSYVAATTQPGVRFFLNQRSITVAANSTKTFNIRMVANRDQLRKTIDPTVSPTQLDTPRQFVADASGRIVLTPRDSSLTSLRVPVYAAAKPVADLTGSLTPSGGNTGEITLNGRGLNNGEPGGVDSYAALAGAFSLLGTSPEQPLCSDDNTVDCATTELERSYDLANVGITSDAALYGEDDSYLYFAIATHAPLITHVHTQYSVYIDGNSDGEWDYQLLTTYFVDGSDPTDTPVVIGADRDGNLLPSNEEPFITYLNGAPGSVDTNLKDTTAFTMVFPAAAMPKLLNLYPRFGFGVQSIGYFGSVDNLGTTVTADGFPELADQTMSYNVKNPSLTFTVSDGTTDFPAYAVFVDDGVVIDVTTDLSSYTRDRTLGGPKGIMLVHHHNAAGDQAQTIPLPSGIDGVVIG